MAVRHAVMKSFYASQAWQTLRQVTIAQRGPVCQHCGGRVAQSSQLTLHHTIELTPENVHDAQLALNPDNVLVLHRDCHNALHARFGHPPERGVWVVYGPPLAGKSRYIAEHKGRHDLVVEVDRLFAAVTMLPEYDKPDILLGNVMGLYRQLLDNIKTRYGKWHSAWISTGGAVRYQRERLAEELGAELIFCDVSREECLRRLALDEKRRHRLDEWCGYIDKWFAEYVV